TGLDIEGNANVAVGLGIGITKSLELSMGPNLGIHAHLGGSIRSSVDNKIQNRLYISGGYNESIGPKLIGNNFNFKFLIPYRFNNSFIPNTLNVGYQYLETFQNEEIESINFSTSLASNSSLLNIYNLPGETQKYKSWLSTDEESIRNTILYNELANRTNDIGSNSTNINLSNASFKDEYESILDEFYEEQNNSLPSKLQYGLCVEDRNEISIDFNLEFSIPFLPPIVINVGGGIEASDAREYNLSKGYWVKGLPYLQTEMPNPHVPQTTLSDIIIGELWCIIITEFKTNLQNVISQYWRSIRLFFHFDRTGDYQIIELNDRGSTLQIKEESIPATIDSAYCRNWEWGEEPESLTLTKQQKQKIKEFNIQLRMIREEALGLHYGIGGFFNFEPEGEVFGDSTLLSIAYADSEITGLNEDHLAIYWEDSEGFWNPISAIVYPDSNLVKAWITDFQTYTIAPRLPQGSFNLNSNPDSLAADGVSIAQITSEALYNNDGTIIEDGSLFTVQTSRGSIITTDEDVEIAGVQVYVSAGTIQFEVQSDSISVPITLTAYSIQGFATCEMDLDFYDVSFPETPVLLSIVPEHNALRLSWQDVNIPDLAGYKIYYDIDESGAPYNGTANYLGTNSPVIVGNVNEHLLTGLSNNETYFVSITAFDVSDVESSYSNELTDSPELQSVSIISTEMLQDGFKLSWNPVFGANSYNIYRSTNPYADISEMEIVQQTTSTNWTDIDIIVENQYFYRIVVVAY
ncbi:MAG: hypothetical protein H8E57_07065, partial [Candidatus Cloacimonetes bacterium]|nr:hypothetical protein [Candidatus Cloacimonadota bacterium]